ncbi:uncharacterized protein [Primulina huaijiensis]|uniref:uncharacterized protein isoform X2 n=1 Tax=Primulina huaijiensis TaxID=1492673 RepID=UPI003CC749EC
MIQASIRGILLSLLDDPQKKICTAVSVAVSTIAQYDWPDFWPDLAPFLLSLINDQSKPNAVHGAIRCLAVISSDMDDKIVPKLIPVLFPCLLTIVSSPQVHTWSLDANQYVADEDDNTYSCRVSGALLLEEIITSSGMEGLNAVIDSLKRRISDSKQQKDSGTPGWWKVSCSTT